MQATIKSKVPLGLSGMGSYYLYRIAFSAEATLKDNYRSVAYAQDLNNALGILATFSFLSFFPDHVTKPVEELTAGIRRLATIRNACPCRPTLSSATSPRPSTPCPKGSRATKPVTVRPASIPAARSTS